MNGRTDSVDRRARTARSSRAAGYRRLFTRSFSARAAGQWAIGDQALISMALTEFMASSLPASMSLRSDAGRAGLLDDLLGTEDSRFSMVILRQRYSRLRLRPARFRLPKFLTRLGRVRRRRRWAPQNGAEWADGGDRDGNTACWRPKRRDIPGRGNLTQRRSVSFTGSRIMIDDACASLILRAR